MVVGKGRSKGSRGKGVEVVGKGRSRVVGKGRSRVVGKGRRRGISR